MPVNEAALRQRRMSALETLRATTATQLAKVWGSLTAYTSDQQQVWERRASPVVVAAQNRSIDTQIAYLTALLGVFRFDRDTILERAAVDLRLPFISLAKAIGAGDSFESALEQAGRRAAGLGEEGVSSAARAANTQAPGNRIVGWQRTPSGGACDWCLLVAQQTYKSAESADFSHFRAPCHCGVDPVLAN